MTVLDLNRPAPEAQAAPATRLRNVDAELLLLAVLLYDPSALESVDGLRAEHFSESLYGAIFAAIERSIRDGQGCDPTLINPHLANIPAYVESGGIGFLAMLIAKAPHASTAPQFASAIRDCALRREMVALARTMADEASSGEGGALDTLAASERALGELAQAGGDASSFQSAASIVDHALDLARNAKGLPGLTTGLRELDDATGGWRSGVVSVIAGRPGIGKSTAGLAMAKACAQAGKGAIFFSMEMPAFDLGLRLACDVAFDRYAPWGENPNYYRAARGDLTEENWRELDRARSEIRFWPIAIDTRPGLTVSHMQRAARRRMRQWERQGITPGLIVVDHLTITRVENDRSGNKVAEVGDISRGLAEMAKTLDIPVIALCQLSRAVEGRGSDKRPTLADLRWCLPGGALVFDPATGRRRPVSELFAQGGGTVAALDANMTLRAARIGEVRRAGHQHILAITTRLGRRLRCSPGHRILTGKGYKEASELIPGETVGLPRGYPAGHQAATITPERATLLGWLIGDGYLGGSPMLAIGAAADVQIAKGLARTAFPSLNFRERDNGHGRGECTALTFSAGPRAGAGKNPLTRWLREIGAWGKRGSDKRVPAIIFEQPPQIVAAFLRGLYHADGSLKTKAQTISFSSVSEGLCRDVQHLLLRVGVSGAVKCDPRAKGGFASRPRAQWGVEIYGRPHVERFIEKIGFLGAKGVSARAAVTAKTNDAGQADRLPDVATTVALSIKRDLGLTWESLGWRDQGKKMSRETASRLAALHDSGELAVFASSDIYWDEVISVESDGAEETFDLSVPAHGNFCVDDFITHNSGEIEQDARLVCFLHRPEYYCRKPEDESDSEALVEWEAKYAKVKHRLWWLIEKNNNGPTGAVETYCHIASSAIRDKGPS